MEYLGSSVIAETLKSQMNQMYHSEVHFINTIQKAFVGQDKIFISSWLSLLGDPSFIYFTLFSGFVGFRHASGIKLLSAFVMSEWLNFTLKIVLHGERPYWWILTQRSLNPRLPYLSQGSSDCKSDPGNPSSYLQTNTVVWYILVATLNDEIIEKSGFGQTSRILLRRNMWKLYGVFLIFLFISEVVSISNFPHQSIFGVVCGIFIINRVFVRSTWMSWRKPRLLITLSFLLASSYVLHQYSLIITGYPHNWSIPLAKKSCEGRLILDKKPLLRIASLGGSALGLVLSLPSMRETTSMKEGLFRSVCGLLIGALAWKAAESILPLYAFVLHLVFTFTITRLLPSASLYLFSEPRKQHTNKKDK